MPGIIGRFAEFIIFGSITAALVLNIILLTSCEMLIVPGGTLGLYNYEIKTNSNQFTVTDGCVNIESDVSDTAFNCARICAVIALIFGVAILFFGVFKQCICNLPCAGLILGISHLGVQIMLSLVWVIHLGDACNSGCNWGIGATYLLVAQILYLAAGCFSRCLPEPRYKEKKDKEREHDVEVAEPAPQPKPEEAHGEGQQTQPPAAQPY